MNNKIFWENIYKKNIFNKNEKPIFSYFFSKSYWYSKKILEIGCGNGRWLVWLAQKGAEVYGIDYCKNAIKLAKKNFRINNVCGILKVEDARNLSFKDEEFDFVFSLGVIEHFNETIIALKEHYRVLKKGGIVFVTVPNLLAPFTFEHFVFHLLRGTIKYYPASFGKRYLPNQFKKMLLKAKFKDIKIYGNGRIPFFQKEPSRNLFWKYLSEMVIGIGKK